jgi:hypothetical protein
VGDVARQSRLDECPDPRLQIAVLRALLDDSRVPSISFKFFIMSGMATSFLLYKCLLRRVVIDLWACLSSKGSLGLIALPTK